MLAAVEDLQYVPNAHAQHLARAQRTEVGVIVHDVSDPYFAEITRGLQRVATDAGRLLFICNSYRDPAQELEYVELLHGHHIAAIVLAGSGYHDAASTRAIASRLRAYERDRRPGQRHRPARHCPATPSCRPTRPAATSSAENCTGSATARSG